MPLKVAWISLALMLFTYLGYPFFAWFLSRVWRRRTLRGSYFPRVSVVLPVYNEGGRLEEKISNLMSERYPADLVEILVVDDGSTDGAPRELSLRGLPRVKVLFQDRRLGKAAAINRGLGVAGGDVVVFTDARQTLTPDALALLAENFADGRVTAVTGRLSVAPGGADGFFRRYEERLRSWEGAWGSCAGATGALYAVRRAALEPIPPETILDDLVIPVSAARRGRLIYDARALALEEPQDARRTWHRRLRTLAGNWQILFHPLTYRRVFSARTAPQLACHKASRLLFPLFAAAFAASAVAASREWAGILLAAFLVTAALDAALFKSGRAGSVSHALASLVFAPVAALVRYCLGRETALWAK